MSSLHFYRIFACDRKRSDIQFIGRCLGSEENFRFLPQWTPSSGSVALYQDQNHILYFCANVREFPIPRYNKISRYSYNDYVKVSCLYWFGDQSRQGLISQLQDIWREYNGDDRDLKIPTILHEPPPEIETMHTMTGYDS
jgi:hypothetical protein